MGKQVFYLFGLFLTIFISNIYAINPDSTIKVIAPTALSRQIIVILTQNWEDTTGVLFRYERNKLGGQWNQIGDVYIVSVGRNGLAWGTGLHGGAIDEGPVKHEGDGKSPAGVFRLSKIFGYESSDNVRWLNMPYIQVDSCVECVDDTNSIYYNTIIDDRMIKDKDWKSSEIMKLSDNEYEWGIFVENNSMPRIKGNGSCIFLHIWEDDGIPTAGCSAMKEENLIKILHWLNINSSPVLVQLPQMEYNKLKFRWALP